MNKLFYFLTLIILISCKSKTTTNEQENSVKESKSVIIESKINYSKGFKITTENDIKKLIILNPFTNYEIQQTLVLLKPNQKYTPEKGEVIIKSPVKTIIPFSSSYISMIDTLGALNSIVAIENENYIYNKELLNKIKSEEVKAIGNINQIDLETIITLKPELLITIGISGEQSKQIQKLIRAGIPYINNYDWKENHPLGKAEWIKFFGVLFDKEIEANQIFESIEKNYIKLKNLPKVQSPSVLFSSLYNGTWYIPGGNSYASQFIKDAGATYPWINDTTTGSLPLSFETVANKQIAPDIWLNPNYNYLKDMTNDDNRYFSFLKKVKNNVFSQTKRVNPNGGNDYWERGTLRPDLVLKDYIELLKLDSCNEDSLYFFKKINP